MNGKETGELRKTSRAGHSIAHLFCKGEPVVRGIRNIGGTRSIGGT